ncbi:DUF4304 domain-containing protein [Kitasatospora sp. NPDC085879]|uniref:DUF4304 domain-containing protein n=1 Tax=Kitasatospora sp. NPDC085879 TaxID=3154769 RepID=UPI00343F472B
MTAQELYRAMLRDGVAPRLRALGWKGSGLRFELPDPNAWVQLGFQSSRFNSAESLDFTVNISVIGRAAWENHREEHPELPARPNPVVHYGRRFEPVRIGYLLADRRDTWWNISTDQPGDAVDRTADGVVAAVADQAMPEIRRRIAAI